MISFSFGPFRWELANEKDYGIPVPKGPGTPTRLLIAGLLNLLLNVLGVVDGVIRAGGDLVVVNRRKKEVGCEGRVLVGLGGNVTLKATKGSDGILVEGGATVVVVVDAVVVVLSSFLASTLVISAAGAMVSVVILMLGLTSLMGSVSTLPASK